jgi:hypothetical protein
MNLEGQVAVRIMQLHSLMEFMASSEARRDNPKNRERARKLWLEVVRLSTLIASEA